MGRGTARTWLRIGVVVGLVTTSTVALSSAPAPQAGAVGPVPGAPVVVEVSPRGLGALVSWSPADVTVPVTGYSLAAQAMSVAGVTIPAGCGSPAFSSAGPSDTAGLVSGLCDGIPYQVRVTASNGNGTGPASDSSNPVVPLPAGPPSAPMISSVVGRDGQLLVDWVPPTDNGGASLIWYVLTARAGTSTVRVRPAASATSATLSGLVNGTSYRVTLKSRNALGESPGSTQRARPRSATPPGSPVGLQVTTPTAGQLAVSWGSPTDDGGSPITSYWVIAQQVVQQTNPDGSFTWIPSTGPGVISRLTTNQSIALSALSTTTWYQISVLALSAKGASAPATSSTPSMPQVVLQPGAVPLTGATLNALSSWDGTTLVWNAPAPARVPGLQIGNTLVGGISPLTPKGLLAKVTAVTQPSPGTYRFTTTPGSLGDVIAQGGFRAEVNPNDITNAQFVPTVAGVQAIPGALALAGDPKRSFGIDTDLGPLHVKGSATMSANVGVDFHVDLNPFNSTPLVSASGWATETFTSEFTISAWKKFETEWQLGVIEFTPFPISLGGVPFVVFPQVKLFLKVHADGQLNFTTRWVNTVGGRVDWNTDHPTSLQTTNLSQAPKLVTTNIGIVTASTTGYVELSAHAEALLDDVTGPTVIGAAKLQATATLFAPPTDPWFQLDAIVAIKIGWTIDTPPPFKYHKDLAVTLAELDWPLLKRYGSPPAVPVITPASPTVIGGGTIQFSANTPVTWGLGQSTNGDSITSGGLLKTTGLGGRTITVTATNAKNQTGITNVNVGNPFDSPGDLAAYRDSGGTNATLTWTPPANTMDAPLTKYTIVTSPATHTTTVTAAETTALITGLEPNTTYRVIIIASNTNARTSQPAAVTISVRPYQLRELISSTLGGVAGNAQSRSGVISDDGNYVYFESRASNLISQPSGRFQSVYLRDRVRGATLPLNTRTGSDGDTLNAVSRNGQYALFSDSTGLYLYDRQSDTSRMISLAADFNGANMAISNSGSLFVDQNGRIWNLTSGQSVQIPCANGYLFPTFAKFRFTMDDSAIVFGANCQYYFGAYTYSVQAGTSTNLYTPNCSSWNGGNACMDAIEIDATGGHYAAALDTGTSSTALVVDRVRVASAAGHIEVCGMSDDGSRVAFTAHPSLDDSQVPSEGYLWDQGVRTTISGIEYCRGQGFAGASGDLLYEQGQQLWLARSA